MGFASAIAWIGALFAGRWIGFFVFRLWLRLQKECARALGDLGGALAASGIELWADRPARCRINA